MDIAVSKGVYVILDEAHTDLIEEEPAYSLLRRAKDLQNLFVLRSLTKPYGLLGIGVGFAVCRKDLASASVKRRLAGGLGS